MQVFKDFILVKLLNYVSFISVVIVFYLNFFIGIIIIYFGENFKVKLSFIFFMVIIIIRKEIVEMICEYGKFIYFSVGNGE